ncbi:T-complex protein 1 subunit theta isoform X2 [Histomonas meleagridis]|uniref:T-complex protein 1 subunit theta isoform X2 n=1 Tax=Histomonas meleagridis TaxID=135588 RepID=UPI0035598E1B|nr:T-complex protein 1 subunit theta isoform X2 [Histomonas meleagridis]KAH0801188.1 T-complex protein 1 subunit theta isoform X2 [Histomonas meleagridis]
MPTKQTFQGFFKDGTRYFNGTDEVLLRNIDAVVDLSELTRTSLGPNGMKKIIKNHFGKLYVTGDAATILKEAEVQHPAAKMLVSASQMQAEQIGDGTNLVLVFAGECLSRAAELVRAGINTKDIVAGYQAALAKALEILPTLTLNKQIDLMNQDNVAEALKTSLSSHQFLDADHLSKLVASACINANQRAGVKFSVDNVRVAKALGGSVNDSYFVKGFVVQREVMGTIRRMENCNIAVYSTSFDLPESDTKMQTIFTNGEEMTKFNLSKEQRMNEIVSSIAEKGINVVVCQSKITELAMHYLEQHKIMALQLPSNWDIRRLCRAVRAIPLLRIAPPTEDEIGHCPLVEVTEVGSTPLVSFIADGGVSTIVIRGATPNVMEDVERSIEDAVNSYLVMTEYPQLVAGAGACEMELSTQIAKWAESRPGMDQYGARKFAEALEVVPKTIAENSGLKISEFMAKLRAAHNKGEKNAGVDVVELKVEDAEKMGVYDIAHVKEWALKFAIEVVVTILRVDQICMAKPANGPAPRSPEARDID